MARPSYRRRNDGTIEILRPRPWHRLAAAFRSATAALLLVLLGIAGVAAYMLVGMPLLIVAALAAFAGALYRLRKAKRPVAVVRPVGVRRMAP